MLESSNMLKSFSGIGSPNFSALDSNYEIWLVWIISMNSSTRVKLEMNVEFFTSTFDGVIETMFIDSLFSFFTTRLNLNSSSLISISAAKILEALLF